MLCTLSAFNNPSANFWMVTITVPFVPYFLPDLYDYPNERGGINDFVCFLGLISTLWCEVSELRFLGVARCVCACACVCVCVCVRARNNGHPGNTAADHAVTPI